MANPQQRLGRLTPLGAVLSLIETRVSPVAPTTRPLRDARDFTLAEDVVAAAQPPRAIALRDGFPVDSAAVADAGSYAPVSLPLTTRRIDVGEPLPSGADAVLPLDAVTQSGDRVETLAPLVAGEGVLPAGGDVAAHTSLRRAGERVRAVDLAVMSAAGINAVTVRVPHIHVVWASEARSPVIEAAMAAIRHATAEAGSAVTGQSITLEPALGDPETDAVIALGGTGSGRRDRAVHTLVRHGRVEAHGIAVSPGESAAFGFAGAKPVLLVPGRLDAALAVWLMIGRHLVAKLAGGRVDEAPVMLPLKRKVSSTIGLVELMPVRWVERMAEPLGSGYLSFQSLTRSDGWIAVPADSEGYQAGAIVAVRSWP
jgi:molybdopterin biosynthesis enzyme